LGEEGAEEGDAFAVESEEVSTFTFDFGVVVVAAGGSSTLREM